MRYCTFAFDERPEFCRYHINPREDGTKFPYYVPSLGTDAQGPRYFTDRAGFESLFLCLTLEGSGTVTAGGESRLLIPGDLIVLDCIKPHRYESRSDPWRFLWIHIKGYGAREFFNRITPTGFFCRHLRNTLPIHRLYEALIPLVESPTTEHNLEVSERIGDFLHRLARRTLIQEEPPLPDALARTVAYVRDHVEDELTVADLAARENYSVSYFTHLFTRRMGVSPYRFILNQRLQSAAAMLQFTDRRVEEIAAVYRFSDAGRFILHFHRRFGLTPLQYRKAYQRGALSQE